MAPHQTFFVLEN